MRPLLLVVLAGLLAPALAGCVNAPGATTAGAPSAMDAAMAMNVTPPKATDVLAALKGFSEAYPYRQAATPNHLAARDALEKMMKDAGLETERQDFDTTGVVSAVPATGQNVIGIKWGQDRERWVVVGAHYDVTEGAVYGTYDDGSGTIDVAMLAKALAHVNTTRTIAFVEFDQEERGLVGSHAFVEAVTKGTFKHKITVDAMLDLDMVGITWPHPANLICWQNSPSLENETRTLANASKIPADHLEFRKPKGGSSDGASFIAAGIATAYFWSDWDEYVLPDGQVAPVTSGYVGTYPWWHKVDTYDTMVASAGDEATLAAGFQTTLNLVTPLILYMAGPTFTPDGVQPAK
ncbi:MAG: aminopeptidase YwaD [Thermoplasmata archaeon]|jgi:hypothetical protein|nr:aminopeptidase YwaD [Thermoplasmata archaeon]